jgi:hypothetical protein
MDSDSTATQLWNPINPRSPEDGGDMFSETSVLTIATWYKVPEGIYNCYDQEIIPKDGVLEPLIVSLYRGADEQ